jgi:predicted permease
MIALRDALFGLAPIFALFLGGLALRRLGLLSPRHADGLLAAVANIGLPILILATFSRLPLQRELVWLPLSAILTILVTWPIATYAARRFMATRAGQGVFVTGAMIMNLAAVYPFALAMPGSRGLAEIMLFDIGNGLLTLTLTYGLAAWYGGSRGNRLRALSRVARFPPAWALAVALAINLGGMALPARVLDPLQAAGEYSLYLVLLALGVHFRARLPQARAVFAAIAVRSALGLLLGGLWVTLFGLSGVTRAVVLAACAAPVGFNTLVFAAANGLDREYAAATVSVSLLLALLYLPLLLWLT